MMTTFNTRIATNFGKTGLRRTLMSGAAIAAFASIPQVALAQDSDTEGAEDGEFGDRVIVVQARRQNESLQEVPVTVTVIGGEVLDQYGVDQVADVVSRVPTLNVQVGGSGSGGQLSLRGVGSSNISASFDSAVAFDFDGVQVSTMRLVQAGFFDTAQIDVLKGPQSLFFGKSASAGVFAIRSADPTPTWEIGADAQYEFEEQGYTVGGFVSGPITDTLGIRVAAQYNDIDEFVTLQEGTPSVHGDARSSSNFVGRVTLAYDDPTDRFDANLKVQYVRNENDGAIAHGDINCGANGVADSIFLLGGGIIIDPGYDCNANDGKQFLPDAAFPLGESIPTPSAAEGRGGVPFGETDLFFARLLWNLELSDSLTLSSTTGYLDLDATDFDCYSYGGQFPDGAGGFLPGGVGCSDPNNQLQQFTQEIRLTSDLDGPLNFMVGAFYETRDFVFDTAEQAANISLLAPDPVTGFTTDYDRRHETTTDAYSVFGSVIFDITDQLELSGGIRYTDEEKANTISIPYVHAFLAGGAFLNSGFFTGPIEFQDDNFSPEVTLRYQATDDINIFASYKTGFKSGGIDNSALPTNSLATAAANNDFGELVYESETSEGGEIGIKSQFADRTVTVNATAYYYVFDNLQVQNFDAIAIQFSTLNAGELTTTGLDLEFGWRTPIDGLSISANLSYLDAEFSDTFITDPGTDGPGPMGMPPGPIGISGEGDPSSPFSADDTNLDGREASRAPNWSGNIAFDWMIPVGDSLEIGLGGNAIYSASYFTNEDTLNDFRQDSYVALDARASIGDIDGMWKLALVGTNITDEIWANTTGGRPFLPAGGDDFVVTQNRGRQVFVETSFRF